MEDRPIFKTKPKRTYRTRTVQCFRCGTNLQRQMVKPPIYCDECRADVSFYERHPEQVDPKSWHVAIARPYAIPDDPRLSPVQEAATAALEARKESPYADRVRAELGSLNRDRMAIDDKLADIRKRMHEMGMERARLNQERAGLDRLAESLVNEYPDVFEGVE